MLSPKATAHPRRMLISIVCGENHLDRSPALRIDRTTPGHWTVTLNDPPINLCDPEMFAELRMLMDQAEEDKDIKVANCFKNVLSKAAISSFAWVDTSDTFGEKNKGVY